MEDHVKEWRDRQLATAAQRMSERELVRIFGQLRQMLGEWGPRYLNTSEKHRRDQIIEITLAIEEMLTGTKPRAYQEEPQ